MATTLYRSLHKCTALPVILSRRLNILAVNQCYSSYKTPRDSHTEFRRLLSTVENPDFKTDKNLLVKLRKETGFSFSKCKEGLALNNNNYSEAETWLQEQAQKQGWAKATKLQGRTAAEGLIGVAVDNNVAAMVEVNCETDFVGRNETFVDLVSMVTHSALDQRKAIMEQNQKLNTLTNTSTHLREVLLTHDMRDLDTPEGKVDDLVVKVIGKIGENIKLAKAITVTTESTNVIGSHVHGSFIKHVGKLSLGKFGAIVAVQPLRSIDKDKLSTLSNNLAKHIVGMNPKVISCDDVVSDSSEDSEVSNVLLEQAYLLDSSKSVGDLLEEEGLKVVDFVRYECGEK